MIQAESSCFFLNAASHPIIGKAILTASRFYFKGISDTNGDFHEDIVVWNSGLTMTNEKGGAGSNMRGLVNPYACSNFTIRIVSDLTIGGNDYRESELLFPTVDTTEA